LEIGNQSPIACACDGERDQPREQSAVREAPTLTLAEVARLFVDRRDAKFWLNEGARYNHLYWVRAMLSETPEPAPLTRRAVALPQSEGERLRFARARRKAYGFLARAFEYPTDAFLTDVTTPASVEAITAEFRLLADNEDVKEGFALWQQSAGGGATVVGEYGMSPLRAAYTRMIYDTELPCLLPYESVYCNERQVMGKPAGAVAEQYRQAGLEIEGNEMPDHIALECEFIAFLAGQEADAWQAKQRDQAGQIWQTESRFLRDHVLSWSGKFCADLLALARVDFYRAVARLGAGLFNDELIRLRET
jgi:TorA maturation chaperone TorD